jgi:hypothetical protein
MTDPREIATIETGKDVSVSSDKELQIAPSVASAVQEIQAAIIVAKQFPRNLDDCWAKLMKSCQRKSFAEKARYSYPRGGQTISGPSVNLARTAAQCYGNIRWGLSITRDDEDNRTIRGWAWDMESGAYNYAEDHFQKLIYRKKDGWIKPDERDLRELTNRRGAILVRNALLNVIPKDFIEDAEGICIKTLRSDIKDPEGEKKRLILEFDKIGVSVTMLTGYLGTGKWSPDNLIELQGVLNAIKEGSAKRDDYFVKDEEKPANGKISQEDMKPGNPEDHQGHELNLDDKADKKKNGKKAGF